jgi:peptide chain release factor subunit 1
MSELEDIERIEQWKIKRLIASLDQVRGNGTSLISLIIPPREQLPLISKMITEELGKASNIKSRVVRQAVQTAITSVKERLKLYNKVPERGLIIYCGETVNEQGKVEKKVTIDLQPFKSINTSLYLCDNKFDTTVLKELLENDEKFGFIVMDGNGALFATVQGNTTDIITKFSVDLPKKHGRGGQSALRFARLRLEKRHNYVRRVGEVAVQCFISNDRPNVSGLVLAGIADFKNELRNSDLLDMRLGERVVKIVDVGYGGENGLNQAIELSSDTLQNVKLVREKKLILKFFENISMDTHRICYGVIDTVRALEQGAIETLIMYENLPHTRYELKSNATNQSKIIYLSPHEEKNPANFKQEGVDLEVISNQPLSEWIVDNHTNYGAVLEMVTDRSAEGTQFIKGFGGIGGLLRYSIDMNISELDECPIGDDWDEFI